MTVRIGTLFALVLLTGSPAQAKTLTMREAVRLALERNEVGALADQRVVRARAERREAYALLLPQLSITGRYTHRPEEVAREFGGQRGVFQALDAFSAEASARLSLLDASAIPTVRAARRRVEAQREEARESRRALAFETAQTYLVVLSSERLVLAAERRRQQARALSALAEARLQTGLGNRGDLTRARLEVASAELALTRARNAVASARLALGHLLALDGAVNAALVEPAAHAEPSRSVGAISRRAATRRSDLRALRIREEAARLAAQEPWLSLVPKLAFDAGMRLTNETGFSSRNWDYNVGLVATWPLYDGGARYARARARAAERREAQLATKVLTRTIRRQVADALLGLKTASAALEQAEAALTLARQNADEARQRFANGLATGLALADASTAAFEAESEVARQRFALRSAQLALLRAAGAWPDRNPETRAR